MPRHRFSPLPILLSSLLALATGATAKPPTFAEQVAAIETAESTELGRLDEAIAAAGTQAEVIALQRCATYVKLASRLALCEAQLARAVVDATVADALAAQIEKLQADVDAQRTHLPAEYHYAPLAAVVQEVPACDE